MRRMNSGRRVPRIQRAGFTILEVLLSMSILLLGMTAILSMLTFGAALSRTASLRTAGAAALDAVQADLEETFFPLEEDGSVGEPSPVVGRPVPGAPGVIYDAKATQNPDRPDEYRIDVEIAWKASGVRRTQSFTTLLLREVPFGVRMRRRLAGERGRTLPLSSASAPELSPTEPANPNAKE